MTLHPIGVIRNHSINQTFDEILVGAEHVTREVNQNRLDFKLAENVTRRPATLKVAEQLVLTATIRLIKRLTKF